MQKFRFFLVNLIASVLVFFGLLAILSAVFVKRHFGEIDFSAVLFHLRFPLLGNGVPLVAEFTLFVIATSLIVALFVGFPRQIFSAAKKAVNFCVNFTKIKAAPFCKAHAIAVKLTFSLAVLALCINATNNSFKITRYLKTQQVPSTLYEEHYKAFDAANLADFKPTQNLIIIIAESMESTFSGANSPKFAGGGGGQSLNFRPLVSLSQI